MFSIMDFLPTFADIVGGKMPTDRPIDGVDQIDVLTGVSATGHRESLLSFIGGDLVAERWKQWRLYFTDVHPTGIGPQREPGMFSASAPMAGYPKVYNIEMDPHEDLIVTAMFGRRRSGSCDPEHRSHCQGRCDVHQLVRSGKLHGRPRLVPDRTHTDPLGALGRDGYRRRERAEKGDADDCRVLQEKRL
jgi:hypothetical protein